MHVGVEIEPWGEGKNPKERREVGGEILSTSRNSLRTNCANLFACRTNFGSAFALYWSTHRVGMVGTQGERPRGKARTPKGEFGTPGN